MNITIIGCGYVGTAVSNHWHHNSEHILTATTTTPDRLSEIGAIANHSVILDSSDVEALRDVLQDQEAIFLSIAPKGNQQVDEDGYELTYRQTAKNLATVLPQISTIKQVIYTGSCSVYGNAEGAWVDETTAITPSDRYGEILYETEQILQSLSHADLQVCIFRLGAIYGKGRDIKPRFEKLAGTTRAGSGEHFTNWIHLEDIISATIFSLKHRLNGVYNLVDDNPITARELTDQICQQYGFATVKWDISQPRGRSNNRRVSNQKLKQAGYKLLHPTINIK